MSDLDKYEARKIRKRIEIKQGNLKLLLPEIRFLQFVEELEYFQQIIEGVDTDGPTSHVQLHLARTQFEVLQNKYRELLKFLTENSKRIEQHSKDTLLKDLFEAVRESTLFLIANFQNFCLQIEASTEFIYNIRTILWIYDLLSNLKADIGTVKENFSNIQRSANRRRVKETFIHIYTEALATSSLKFEHLAKSFPKLGSFSGHRLRFTTYRVAMSEASKSGDEHIKQPEQEETETSNKDKQPQVAEGTQSEVTTDPQQDTAKEPPPKATEESIAAATKETQAETADVPPVDTIAKPQLELTESHELDVIEKPQPETIEGQQPEITDEIKIEATVKSQQVVTEKEKEGNILNSKVDTQIKAEFPQGDQNDIQDYTDERNDIKEQEENTIKSDVTESKEAAENPAEVGYEEEGIAGADDSSDLKTPSNFSLTSLRVQAQEELRAEMQTHKLKIENALTELTNLENKLVDLNKIILQRKRSFKRNLEEIEKQKRVIADEIEVLEDDKPRRLQDVAVQIGQLTGLTEERIRDLEKQKDDIKNRSLVQASKLSEAARELLAFESSKIQNLKQLLQETMEETEKDEIQASIYLVKRTFAEELGVLKKIQNVENFQVDDHGVFYFDKTKTKTYVTSVGSAYLRDSGTIGPRGESASFETSCTSSEVASRLDTQKVRASIDQNASESSSFTSQITVEETKGK